MLRKNKNEFNEKNARLSLSFVYIGKNWAPRNKSLKPTPGRSASSWAWASQTPSPLGFGRRGGLTLCYVFQEMARFASIQSLLITAGPDGLVAVELVALGTPDHRLLADDCVPDHKALDSSP